MYTKISTKAPPIAIMDPWTGWYAGLNAGYVDGPATINNTAAVTSASTFPGNTVAMVTSATQFLTAPGQNGFIGGAQVGYNYVITPKVIAGWEADIQSSRLRGTVAGTSSVAAPGTIPFFTDTAVTSIVASRSLDWIGTIRGRLGGLVTPNLLLYATGGLAYGEVRSNATVTQTFALSPALAFFSPPVNVSGGAFGATRAGYTIGAGGEWMFLSHWSAKLEYLYYDLGSAHYGTGISQFDAFGVLTNGVGIDAANTTSHVRFDGNIVRAGVNYHFN
jgi:outer membrane immunogenic protein